MAKGKRPEITLPKLDDLFSSQESREEESLSKIRDIPLEMIDDFPEHPFKVKDDEDMMHLVESVIEHGILVPAILRMKEDGRYELIAGHRRKRACQLAGLETLRSEVVDLDRDEATIYMVDSNLQRTTILPSEKAFSYKMRLEAMKRQGKRSDLTSTPLVSKFRTDEKIGKDVGESREQIRRYIRLTELIAPILEMVDDGKIALRPAVEISYLPEELQYELFGSMEQEDCTPSHAQAVRMRKLLDEGKLTAESIYAILSEEKPNQKEKLVLREDRIVNLIPPSIPMAKREDYIIKALTYYAKYRERNREDEKDSR
ncbi:MAG: ParB/RepB/Spo0J family partition protein [Firmicutes bacterium]|nr:ParB/RepB/Spo0J family partition protein [Bacillota bacterium]